ncbi:hypothetical protein QYS36_09625 [Pseudomonas sp. G34]|uniref:hypothetical protein n=1 Tax=Pseudomonas sp. G34 TaxID=3059083 RepID=UPI002809D0A5|nr:hypothetical protein [Pseudomonas sp. G34]MDQ7985199.1 hypothetical protein [Pseudomonas sp. G34]
MSETGNAIIFFTTQLVLPLGLAYAYCRKTGIPSDTWRAGGIALIALSSAILLFTGLLGLPAYVKNVGFVTDRSMGWTCGAVGIVGGLAMGALARRFEGKRAR